MCDSGVCGNSDASVVLVVCKWYCTCSGGGRRSRRVCSSGGTNLYLISFILQSVQTQYITQVHYILPYESVKGEALRSTQCPQSYFFY